MPDSTPSEQAALDVRRILFVNSLVPIGALVLLASLLAFQLYRLNEANAWVSHTLDVRRMSNVVAATLQRMESGERGYLIALKPAFKEPFTASRDDLEGYYDDLEKLVSDNPTQVEAVKDMRRLTAEWLVNADTEIRMAERRDPGFQRYFADAKGANTMNALWDRITQFRELEARLMEERQATQQQQGTIAAFVGLLGLVAAAVFYLLFSRRQHAMLETSYNANLSLVQAQKKHLELANENLTAQAEELQAQNEEIMAQSEELQAQNEEITAQSEELTTQTEELMNQNDELARLSAEAMAATRLKSEFLANMSHELRTPLNSIIGYTELVVLNKRVELPEKIRNNLNVVLRNGRHLLALINDILDLAKVEAGKATVYAERIPVSQLVSGVVTITEALARERGLALDVEIPTDAGFIVTDETKARQIVLNLVSNAIKFTQTGGVTVRVVPTEDAFAFVVSDTGIGIKPEDQGLIFEEFRQVDASTTRQAGGSGLGLAIARRLAGLLGGELELTRSEANVGSTFTLTLPRTNAGSEPVIGPVPVRHAIPVLQAGKQVVIAIDDDTEMLQLISEKLRDTPYQVVPASSGESGLALARELKPYAITLDVMMPEMDGWQVLRALKSDPATEDIPVLVLSFVDNRILGFSLGASAYMVKPVEQQQLLGALDRFAEGLRRGDGHVLVVEDEAEARDLYVELLGKEGIRVVQAADGREGVAAIQREKPAVVLLDLMMPHMDGFEVVSWMRSHPETRGIPVIVVTAKELTREDMERLSDVKRVLRKGDLAPHMLVNDLKGLLDGSRT